MRSLGRSRLLDHASYLDSLCPLRASLAFLRPTDEAAPGRPFPRPTTEADEASFLCSPHRRFRAPIVSLSARLLLSFARPVRQASYLPVSSSLASPLDRLLPLRAPLRSPHQALALPPLSLARRLLSPGLSLPLSPHPAPSFVLFSRPVHARPAARPDPSLIASQSPIHTARFKSGFPPATPRLFPSSPFDTQIWTSPSLPSPLRATSPLPLRSTFSVRSSPSDVTSAASAPDPSRRSSSPRQKKTSIPRKRLARPSPRELPPSPPLVSPPLPFPSQLCVFSPRFHILPPPISPPSFFYCRPARPVQLFAAGWPSCAVSARVEAWRPRRAVSSATRRPERETRGTGKHRPPPAPRFLHSSSDLHRTLLPLRLTIFSPLRGRLPSATPRPLTSPSLSSPFFFHRPPRSDPTPSAGNPLRRSPPGTYAIVLATRRP